jgi:hypothetical protein
LSLALSLLALVVALSGAAVAAGLAANSVGTKQLKKNAVTAKKIRANAVTGAKIKDGALTGADIADGTVGAGDLAPGLLSAQPVVLEHALSAPAATSVTVVAGIEFRAQCTAGGGEGNATWSLDTVGHPVAQGRRHRHDETALRFGVRRYRGRGDRPHGRVRDHGVRGDRAGRFEPLGPRLGRGPGHRLRIVRHARRGLRPRVAREGGRRRHRSKV